MSGMIGCIMVPTSTYVGIHLYLGNIFTSLGNALDSFTVGLAGEFLRSIEPVIFWAYYYYYYYYYFRFEGNDII
jgi:hypothetical protein